MMTIGELANLAGTTVRSVRYYHSNGLLEEPQRQPNGYRMYRAVDLARLSRIRRLRDLGIPVAKIAELLDGDAHDTRSALDALDKELAAKAEQIAVQRAHIESLRRNADPELPDAFSEVLAQYVVAGAPTAWIDNERELLILALTVSGGDPEVCDSLLSAHRRALAKPNRKQAIELITRMYALTDAPADADTIAALAIQFCDFTERVLPEQAAPERPSPTRLVAVLREHQADRSTPTQERFAKAVAAEFAARQSRP